MVLAVAGNEANPLLAGVGGWSVPEVRAWNKTTAFYFAAQGRLWRNPSFVEWGGARGWAGEQRGGNECGFARLCAAGSAPGGGQRGRRSAGGPSGVLRLEAAVRDHLKKWFGPVVDSWRTLQAYPLARALPQQRHAEWEQTPVRLGGSGGVYMCGDYRETASIQGALASGRRAAEAVIQDLAGSAGG